MTSQGTAHGRFQRAIHSRHVQNAEMAAREMGGLSLADSLAPPRQMRSPRLRYVPRSRYEPEHRKETRHRRLRSVADASAFVLLGLFIGGALGYWIGDMATNTDDPYLDTGAALGLVAGALFGAAFVLILVLRPRD